MEKNGYEKEFPGQGSGAKPAWGFAKPFGLMEKWPKTAGGEPEAPAFLTHCTSLNLEPEMLTGMLSAYGIPCAEMYPENGEFGKVILGMSGTGVDIYVPASMLEEAKSLIAQEENADELP